MNKLIFGLFLLSSLSTAQMLSPERRQALIDHLVSPPENPCGQNIKPSCTCKSDSTITCSTEVRCPAGHSDAQFICENGKEFDAEAIRNRIRTQLLNSDANPCGAGQEPSCICKDDSPAVLGSGPPCEGTLPRQKIPKSCECPNGDPIVVREFIQNIRENLQKRTEESRTEQKQALIDRLVSHPENPCGQNIKPSCSCKSDPTITCSTEAPCPAGRSDAQFICENGNEFDPEAIRNRIRTQLLNSDANPCGAGQDPTCICQDNTPAILGSGPPCEGTLH